MAYCKAMNTLAAVLWVFFVNGNYSNDYNDPKSGAHTEAFRLKFEQSEIDLNWNMLIAHASYMILNGKYRRKI